MSDPAASNQLTPAFLATMLELTIATLAIPPDASPERVAALREAVRVSLFAYDPHTPQEAMLAAQLVAMQFASMEWLRRMSLPDTAETMRNRHNSSAATMIRLSGTLTKELLLWQARRTMQQRTARSPAMSTGLTQTARPAAATSIHPQPNNPMQSGAAAARPEIGRPPATVARDAAPVPSGIIDATAIDEIARRAVAAAVTRAA